MAAVKYISTQESKINSIVINKGQLIFTTDTGSVYWDYSELDRIKLTDIVVLDDSSSMPENPVSKFYYFKNDLSLYYYNAGTWDIIGSNIEERLNTLEYRTEWHPISGTGVV